MQISIISNGNKLIMYISNYIKVYKNNFFKNTKMNL